MKVLDINPNCCWSFQGPDRETIERLRAAVEIEDAGLRKETLERIEGKAFGFVGDPTNLDFAPHFFDEVNVNLAPEEAERNSLRQCVRRWSKSPAWMREDAEETAFSGTFWRRIVSRLVPNRMEPKAA